MFKISWGTADNAVYAKFPLRKLIRRLSLETFVNSILVFWSFTKSFLIHTSVNARKKYTSTVGHEKDMSSFVSQSVTACARPTVGSGNYHDDLFQINDLFKVER